jgi:hypothetical protein
MNPIKTGLCNKAVRPLIDTPIGQSGATGSYQPAQYTVNAEIHAQDSVTFSGS